MWRGSHVLPLITPGKHQGRLRSISSRRVRSLLAHYWKLGSILITRYMMVKKPIADRFPSQTLPYPLSPTSPSTISLGVPQPHNFEPKTQQEVSSFPSSTVAPDESRDKVMAQTKDAGQNELPQALRVGRGSLNDQMDDRQAAPKIGPAQLTPRSSSESLRTGAFPTAAPTESAVSHPPSNNPYSRMRSDGPPGAPANDVNSAAVWAEDSVNPSSFSTQNHCKIESVPHRYRCDVHCRCSPGTISWQILSHYTTTISFEGSLRRTMDGFQAVARRADVRISCVF